MRSTSTPWVSNLFMRISLGLTLMIFGISFYRDFEPFVANVVDGLGDMQLIGNIWAYLLPGLLLFGGGLLLVGRYAFVTAWVLGIALGSIPVGMAMKVLMTNYVLQDALDFIYPIFVWMLVAHVAVNIPVVEETEEEDDE